MARGARPNAPGSLYRPDFITCFKKMRGKELVLSLAKEMAQGIVDIHDFNHRNRFDINRLGKNQACNDRRNYHNHIII